MKKSVSGGSTRPTVWTEIRQPWSCSASASRPDGSPEARHLGRHSHQDFPSRCYRTPTDTYLLHFDRPLAHARHYVGIAQGGNPHRRLAEHLAGHGSPPVRAVSRGQAAERNIFHDLSATLSAVEQGEIRVGAKTRLPTLATLRELRPQLLEGDYFGEDDRPYERADDAIRSPSSSWCKPLDGRLGLQGVGSS
jgi:hypothetical protein